MRSPISLLLATLLALTAANAYELHVYFQDDLEVRVTGDLATPCQDFPAQVRNNKVNRITFDKGSLTTEFMVWSKINCGGELVKRASSGTYYIEPNSQVGSLKVM